MILNSPYITGSLTVTGNANVQGTLTVTGSLSGTASLALNSNLLQGTGSTGFASTSSVSTASGSVSSRLTQIEQVYATTGSNSFRATQSITGSLTVTGQIIAQTLNVQQVTSSIVFSSGSNVFGSDLNSRQTFTGSVLITGSLVVNTTGTEFQVTNNGVVMGNLSTDNHAITGSLNMTGSLGINAASSFRFNGVGDNSHAVGYDATVDGAFLRGQNGIRLITGGGSGIERMRISAAGTASFTSNTLSNSADAATINLKQNSTTANTGIYLERSGEQKGYYIYMGGSVDSLTFQRNNAGTKADVMSLTRDGNVGIGVTNPTGSLTIKAEVTNTPTIAFQNSLGGPNSAISNYASAVQTFTVIGTNVYVNSAAGLARFNTNYEGSGITFDEGIIRFSTGTTSITPTTRMNIESNGKISINAPTLADAFNVQGANNYWTSIFTSGTTTSQAYGVYVKAGTNASDVSFLIQNTSGTDILRILGTGTTTFSGSVTASGVTATEIYANSSINMLNGYVRLRNAANTATYGLLIQKAIWIGSGTDYSPAIAAETGYGIYTYTNGASSPSGPYVSPGGTTWTNGSSDSRKKKNFETTQGLTEVLQIEPIKYHFNEDDDNSKKRLGFKAQNILPLIPEMVLEKDEFAEDGSPYLTITPDYILPVLVKAIQELQAQITELKNK